MSDRSDFLDWVRTSLYQAELAIHNGDARPRRALWSRKEPVSVLGAWRNATGQQELDELFASLARQFSNCTSYRFELVSYDVTKTWRTRRAWNTPPLQWTASRAAMSCGLPRFTAGKTMAGRSPIVTETQ